MAENKLTLVKRLREIIFYNERIKNAIKQNLTMNINESIEQLEDNKAFLNSKRDIKVVDDDTYKQLLDTSSSNELDYNERVNFDIAHNLKIVDKTIRTINNLIEQLKDKEVSFTPEREDEPVGEYDSFKPEQEEYFEVGAEEYLEQNPDEPGPKPHGTGWKLEDGRWVKEGGRKTKRTNKMKRTKKINKRKTNKRKTKKRKTKKRKTRY
jgi:hypothetical protein